MKSKYFLEWREKLNKEMAVFNGKIAVDKNDGETASTVSGATANTKVTSTQKAMDAKRQATDRNPVNRLAGAFTGKVGFRLEDGADQSSPEKG